MLEVFNLSEINIPYGILHDQRLNEVKCEGNRFVFTFDIKIHPEDYTNDYYKQYLDYKHCDMIVCMNDEPFNYFRMISALNNKGEFKGISLNREDFLEALNNSDSVTFVDCSATYNEFAIELCASFYKAKGKFKKYKKYGMCYALIDTEKVEWKWY